MDIPHQIDVVPIWRNQGNANTERVILVSVITGIQTNTVHAERSGVSTSVSYFRNPRFESRTEDRLA
jgi:hypothetical protein